MLFKTRQNKSRANKISSGMLRKLAFILLASSAICAIAKTNGPKPSKLGRPDPTDEVFTNGLVTTIHIQISPTNLAALRSSSHAYVKATFLEGSNTWEEVGLHLKGSAGSVRGVDDNPAMTINFDKYVDRQRFHGLQKIHLNNSVQDGSYMTELLCGEMFRASGVPAARTTHARVYLNGKDLKLYVLKEGFDKTFLGRYYKNPKGNLYDGGFLREISEPIELITGSEAKDRRELKALIAAANETDPSVRMEKLNSLLDMEEFISLIAMEHMTWHWDGYMYKKNNYKVYHDPETGKISFFPHGMDQMFWNPPPAIMPGSPPGGGLPPDGLIARAILQTSEGRRRFKERLGVLYTNVFQVEALTNRLNQIQARIRPVLASINPGDASNHDGQADRIRQLVAQSASRIGKLLTEPEPKPLKFDSQGLISLAALTEWRPAKSTADKAETERSSSVDGKKCFHIKAGIDGKCTAAWRIKVLLEPGSYQFEGMVRTAGVVPLPPPKPPTPAPGAPPPAPPELKGDGAGIRISRPKDKKPRSNQAVDDTPWKKLEYTFTVDSGNDEVELICELRAAKGEAWFDIDSLKLRKVPTIETKR
ncbi:MAG TPA: CotH kinase family protein [Candidatus Saccharimonadales bacterium]|nr:CotH kinase family protein [Candidatus Saccharimonadales bacterium]